MANYYYAFSGHKYGLDRVKRGVALIKAMKKEGIEIDLLVNDFRAGLAAQDMGVTGAVTIENIMDVDVIAEKGDTVFIDTPEDIDKRLEQYTERFDSVICVTDDCEYVSKMGEIVMKPDCKDEKKCIETPIIDSEYFDILPKEERILFFFSDADYDKEVLAHSEFFTGMDMELLLGYYFFVKYEDKLAEIFTKLHEAEEYPELIRRSSTVVTASSQCALESKAAGADVVYIRRENDSLCLTEIMKEYNIKIIDEYDNNELKNLISKKSNLVQNVPDKMDIIVRRLKESCNL